MPRPAKGVPATEPHTERDAADPLAFRKRFGWEVQRRRLEQGWTQGELADLVGLSLKYVGEIERGGANLTSAIIEHLCAVLGWDLFDGKNRQMSALLAMRQFLLHEIDSAIANLDAARRLIIQIHDHPNEPAGSARPGPAPRPGRRRE